LEVGIGSLREPVVKKRGEVGWVEDLEAKNQEMRAVRLCVRHLSGIKSVEIPAQVFAGLTVSEGGGLAR
jgi:hypothetical protein